MIEIDRVSKRFGRFTALREVSLVVGPGEAVALWGPNGAGKTTLLRCTLGLLNFRGSIRIDGIDVRRRGKDARAALGYVPQELAFYDDFRVVEAIGFFARLRRVDREACRRALRISGLGSHGRKRVRELSGGMKQRLALGIAMLTDPGILLLDEPTSNLDQAGRRELLGELDVLHKRGKTILFTSHRPEEVEELADRVVTMESGRIVDDAPPRDRRPSDCGARSAEIRVPEACLERALGALRSEGFRTTATGSGEAVWCRNGCDAGGEGERAWARGRGA